MRLKVTDANGVEQIIEAQSIVLGDGSFLGGTNGNAYVAVKDQPALGQSYVYKNRHTGTGTDLGTTDDLSILGLPFDSLTFTKSAGVNLGTIDVHLTPLGGIIDISALNAETIAITATSDGNAISQPILLLNGSNPTIGAEVIASGLGTGLYYLYKGK